MVSFKWTIGDKWILFFWSNSPFGASWGAQLQAEGHQGAGWWHQTGDALERGWNFHLQRDERFQWICWVEKMLTFPRKSTTWEICRDIYIYIYLWSSLSKSKFQRNWICSCSHIQISFTVFTDCFGLQSCKTPWSHAWIDVFPQVMPLLKQKKLILAPWCETAECFPQISTHCFTGDPVTCPFYWEIFVRLSKNEADTPIFWYWTLGKMLGFRGIPLIFKQILLTPREIFIPKHVDMVGHR